MRRDLRGCRILVTGASSGIGRKFAELAAQAGARVAVTARSREPLEELTRTLTAQGADTFAVPADITVDADRSNLLTRVVERFDGLDVLVNNAGVAGSGHFATGSEDLLRRIMEVNFFAPAELIRRAVPILTKGRQPAVVNVSSMCGRRAMPAWPEYSASKFALCGLSECLRGEFVREGIDVLLIVPGLTRGDLRKNLLRDDAKMRIDLDKGVPVETAAGRILDALRKNRRETVIGGDAWWMLLLNRFFPRLLDRLIARKVRKLYAEASPGR